MNKNNHDNNTEAVKIANALKPFAKKWFDEWGKSCLRSKKMTVSTAPNGTVIGVKDAFSDTEMFVKYMAECSSAQVGDTVWCKWMYDNMQTLYADSMGDISEKDVTFNNVTVDSVLDVTKRRCVATLSSAGWYRVLTYTAASVNQALGYIGASIDLKVSRRFSSGGSEVHNIMLLLVNGKVKFVDETSCISANLYIDAIRYSVNGLYGYIDIHYNVSVSNQIAVNFDVNTIPEHQYRFIANSLEAVADAPSGEIVLATYNFNANGTGDITINGTFDVTQRRCYATLSSAGWYRVLTTNDISGTVIDFTIGRPYGANPAEAHKISFFIVGGGKSSFACEASTSNTLGVDKIRATYGGGKMYFDVHYNLSTSNQVLVYFDVKGKGQENVSTVANSLEAVADAPSGETVLTTYEFQATSGGRISITPTTGSAHGNFGNCFYEKIGNLVHLHLGLAGLTAGSQLTIYTMPEGLRPDMPVSAGGFGANMGIAACGRINNTGTVNVQIASSTYAMIDMWYIAKQ